jgi:hypothetical protein
MLLVGATSAGAAEPVIGFGDRTVLMGAEASLHGALKIADVGPGKTGWIESWTGPESLVWKGQIERSGNFEIAAVIESSGEGCSIRVTVDQRRVQAGCGAEGWNRIQLGDLQLEAGSQTVKVESAGSRPLSKFFSLEFVTPAARKRLAAVARKQKVDVGWMQKAGYGLMFHWTSQSMPREGDGLSYCEAVSRFPVDSFAETVSRMGAGFVVFTTSHAGFYFPGPNAVINSILPGRTCSRDLVSDLADALNRRGIRLELYFHPGHDDMPFWERTHFKEDKNAYFAQWCSIISSIGNRYGTKLDGFWFDDGAFTYYPFNPPWEKMTAAARAGNPRRVITYNSWVLPKLTDFYDLYAGENAVWETKYEGLDFLPVGGTGRYTGGPEEGMQAELLVLINDDWGHFKKNVPITAPRTNANAIIPKLKDAISRKMIPLLDVEVYQDGTFSPDTVKLFDDIRGSIKPNNNRP